MIQRIAAFERVSASRFAGVWRERFGENAPVPEIRLPRRATTGSAGYDFFSPVAFSLKPGESFTVPTGVRVRMDEGWVLQLYPRSGLGFRYRLQLNNTVGVIDSDYYRSENEGHIFVRLTNAGDRPVSVEAGEAFCQGVFVPFGITTDDEVTAQRNGGFGSTSSPETVQSPSKG